jgi:hypothetical protein
VLYQWLVFLHLFGLVLFLLAHGASMFAVFRVRQEPDLSRAKLLLELSARGTQTSYLGLILLAVGGLGAAFNQSWLVQPWIVASYVVLIGVILLMYAVGAGFYYRVREAVEGAKGEPPITGADLNTRLQNRRPEALATIGLVGLAILVWLMVFKPGLG